MVNKKTTRAAIYSLSTLSMLVVGLNAGLSAIQTAFPNASVLMVQMSTSGISFSVIFMSLFVARIYAKLTRRTALIIGECILVATAVAAYMYHPDILWVFLYSVAIGIASSLILPAAGSTSIDYFSHEERLFISGRQSLFSSFGGIWFSLMGGFLAGISWYTSYLVFLLGLPVLVITLLYFPRDTRGRCVTPVNPRRARLSWVIVQYGLMAVLYVILFGVFMSNISIFVADEKMGTTASAGAVGAMSMAGGVLGGLVLKPLIKRLGSHTFVFTFCGAAAGFALLAVAGNVYVCCLSAMLIGMCQSIHLPNCLLSLAKRIHPNQSVIGTLVVSCLAPNIGTLVSPVIMTNLSVALLGPSVRGRFGMTAAIALLIAIVIQFVIRRPTSHAAVE